MTERWARIVRRPPPEPLEIEVGDSPTVSRFDNETEACRHCPTPEVHPTRVGGVLTYEGRCDPDTCERHDHSDSPTVSEPRFKGDLPRTETGRNYAASFEHGSDRWAAAVNLACAIEAEAVPPIDVERLRQACSLVGLKLAETPVRAIARQYARLRASDTDHD